MSKEFLKLFERFEIYEFDINNIEDVKKLINLLEKENTQLKSVLKEIREYIKDNISQEFRNGRNDEFYLELNERKLKIY